MSNNADFDALARELRALRPTEAGDTQEAMLVVRLVHGLSEQRWQEFCRAFPSSQWCALPVQSEHAVSLSADMRPDMQAPLPPGQMPDGLTDALAAGLFSAQISRELMRRTRSGGELSLIFAALADKDTLLLMLGADVVARLETVLSQTMRGAMEGCDSLGSPSPGRFALLLPGAGLMRARMLAENLQAAFSAAALPLLPGGESSDGSKITCAVSILCTNSSSHTTLPEMLLLAHNGLDSALNGQGIVICREGHSTLTESTTLVHSSEKRFLFFGGE